MIFWKRWKLNSLLKKAKKEVEKREQGKQGNMQDETHLHLTIAKIYEDNRFDRSLPFAELLALEYYRHAANLGSSEAQYLLGTRKLEQGKFWSEFAKGIYGRPLHETYAKDAYNEAFQYLQEAKKTGFPNALRTLGLAYIQGWGVEINKEMGFQYIIESIDRENAWDRAPEIFKQLGLNNPEFFSTIMAMRGKSMLGN